MMMKLAFTADTTLTPSDCVRAMFENTGKDGAVLIPNWSRDPFDEEDPAPIAKEAVMSWTEEDCEEAIAAYEALDSDLKAVMEALPSWRENAETAEKLLTPELFKVWELYVRPWEMSRPEEYGYLCGETDESEWTDEDRALIEEGNCERFADAVRRLGDLPAAFCEVNQAMRIAVELSLGAPAVIIDGERRVLAAAMAINRFGTSLRDVPDER